MKTVSKTRHGQCRRPAAAVAVGLLIGPLLANEASAQSGTWQLYPPQSTTYTTKVQQPINADGSSVFKNNGNSAIPVKFGLSTSPGPVVFQSILSNNPGNTTDDYSYLTFTPGSPLTFQGLGTLSAVYTFTQGNCHLGALRWSVNVAPGQSVFIYYGGTPSFTDCTGTGNSQSGQNMIGQPDLRYDTSQIPGGTFYDSYSHALSLVGGYNVNYVALVLDGGAGGDQRATIGTVTVNNNTFVAASGSTTTCDLPAATIKVTKTAGNGTGPISPISVQPGDDDSRFRIVDCKYMYNLATRSLTGAGTYKVEVVIDGTPAAGPAIFKLQ